MTTTPDHTPPHTLVPNTRARDLLERIPMESPQHEAVINLVYTTDQIMLRYARVLRKHGITQAQIMILKILEFAGHPMPILEIAQSTLTAVPGITGLIDRLEEAGLVTRQRCQEDRRIVRVALTRSAHKLLGELQEPAIQMHARIFGVLNPEELATFTRLLKKLQAGLGTEAVAEDPVVPDGRIILGHD
jgi:DNA-binding MarR family transcriptional regulator